MKFKNSLLTLITASFISSSISAQEEPADTSKWYDKVYVGGGLGFSLAYTDVKQYPGILGAPALKFRNELGYNGGILAGYQFNNVWALEGNLSYAVLNGTKRSRYWWFTADVWQWDIGTRVNLLNAFSPTTVESRKWDLYANGGLGLSAFRARRHWLINGVSTDPIQNAEGYETHRNYLVDLKNVKKRRTIEAALYLGIGASYRLNSKIDLFVDLRTHFLNTDKLDATQLGNSGKDSYLNASAGVIYHISGTEKTRKVDEDNPQVKLDEILAKFEDGDADGVPNYQDKDLNTPAGVKVYPDGTAIDTDGDGVPDYKDQEKISPCKEVDANGVSKDSDKDGVADCNDVEPNTKAGAQVDGKGKAIAVSSTVAPASIAQAGNQASSLSAGAMSGLPPVFFPMNSSSISYKNYESLTQVAQFLKANPSAKLIIAGNSDKVGTEEYNKVLAQKRAQSVVDYLVKNNGIEASRLSIVSNGSSATISTKRNSQQDRRVDFLLSK